MRRQPNKKHERPHARNTCIGQAEARGSGDGSRNASSGRRPPTCPPQRRRSATHNLLLRAAANCGKSENTTNRNAYCLTTLHMIHACPHHAGRPPEKQHELQCIRPTPSNYLRELPRLPRAPRLVVPSSRRRLSEASSTRASSPAASSAADISRLLLAARDGQSQVRAACAKRLVLRLK